MMTSYPNNSLPLADLLQFAADNQLTTSLDLRSNLTAGRIDIREGEVIDALFGGLQGEEAVYAALSSSSLSAYRGPEPKHSAIRRISASMSQLLLEGSRRKSESIVPEADAELSWRQTGPGSRSTKEPRSIRSSECTLSRLRQLRLTLVSLVALTIVAAVGFATWRWPARDVVEIEASTASGVEEAANQSAPAVVNGELVPPRLLTAGKPRLPGIGLVPSSTLILQVLVDETGAVTGAKINRPRTELVAFEDAAIRSLLGARFEPAKRNGRPVSTWTSVPVTFEVGSEPAMLVGQLGNPERD